MEHIIKSDFMIKRSQMKGQLFYQENYNQRWFELTPSILRYKDGTKESGPNKLKGTVALNAILSVEEANPNIIGHRPNAFQIHYRVFDSLVGELRTLYVIALFDEQREEWIAAIRKAAIGAGGLKGQKFHPGIWAGKSFSCCGHINRRDEGCTQVTSCSLNKNNNDNHGRHGKNIELHEKPAKSIPLLTNSHEKQAKSIPLPNNSNTREENFPSQTPTPKPRQRNLKPVPDVMPENVKVIALYDYFAISKNHIDLLQGEEYTLLEEFQNDDMPWKVQSAEGEIGLVPKNYIQAITGSMNDLKLFEWFYSNTSKVQSENILSEDGREGCFIVRESAKSDYLYALSVLTRKAKNIEKLEDPYITKHYHIKMDGDNKFFLNDKHLFDNVPQLIYYQKRKKYRLRLCVDPTALRSWIVH